MLSHICLVLVLPCLSFPGYLASKLFGLLFPILCQLTLLFRLLSSFFKVSLDVLRELDSLVGVPFSSFHLIFQPFILKAQAFEVLEQ